MRKANCLKSSLLLCVLVAFPSFAIEPKGKVDTQAWKRPLLAHTWNADDSSPTYCAVALPRASAVPSESSLNCTKAGKSIFTFTAQLEPLSMFSTSELEPKLVTVWVSGSGAYRVVVFTYAGDKIIQTLDVGSKLMPEFVYPRDQLGDAQQRIVVSKLNWVKDAKSGSDVMQPTTADIYRWDGKAYQVKRDVAWQDRLAID